MSLRHFALAFLAALTTAAAPAPVYRLQTVIPLKGKAPSWDYLTFEAKRGYVFLGRRAEGVTVVDPATSRVVATIANSQGANIALLVPDLDRGYTANGDGSTTIFQLSTLKTQQRLSMGEAADAASYDPVTRQVVFTFGDSKELVFLDTATNTVVARLAMQAEELEGVAMVGDGTMWVNERDIAKLARVDIRTHKLIAEYKLPGCTLPTGLAYDRANDRVFVGCKGDAPVLTVVNGATGAIVATLEIGRGNDGLVYDGATRRIIASNGIDGNMVIVDQTSADSYALASAFTTRPIARTLAYDPATRRIFTMTAEGMVDPLLRRNPRAKGFSPNRYYDDSLVLLVFAEQR